MSGEQRLQTRDQRIVTRLTAAIDEQASAAREFRPRALDLPAMLRRNGLMHTILFLSGKSDTDKALAKVLLAGIVAALGDETVGNDRNDPQSYGKSLAKEDFPTYLRHWESAVAAASWLKLLVEARPQPARGSTSASATPEASRSSNAVPSGPAGAPG